MPRPRPTHHAGEHRPPGAPRESGRRPTARSNVTAPAAPPVAGPGKHEEFLTTFLNDNPQWEKYRTWSDETTIAEYNGPVGERILHATLTASTPVPLVQTLMQHLDAPLPAGDAEPHEPLRDTGRHRASHPARTWHAPNRTMAFEHTPHAADDRWTLYGGEDINHADRAVRLSAGVGHDALAQLADTEAWLAGPPPAPARQAPFASRLPAAAPQRHGRVR
ncbi:hypothetical protein ABZY68_36785 [Streptomyces sp. NPDC006482]|uniref:hypothetical protein n=1 Tax=Streptomyces sp. NPDC006482 TaxID=3154306 RepID=UPI0033A695AA